MLLISKKSYYIHYFNINENNIKETWKGIKQLITLKQTKNSIPISLEVGGFKLSNSQAIANAFNNYFSTVGSSLANSIPIVQTNIETSLNAPLCHSSVLYPASITEIEDEISDLNSSKSTGPFSIPTKLLKTLRFLLSGPLTYLFNCSILTGVVPDKLEIARVIPVYKKGPKVIVSNYRPISLLSIFNKILEKLIYKRLLHFLEHNHVLFDGQFGF